MTADSPSGAIAAVDIGSNSIKMTVARTGGDGKIEQFDWTSEVVRLGQGLDQTGRLDERRIELAIATLSRFAARANELGVGRIVAVATEATRSAANGQVFLDRVRDETGIDVRVVDGQEEAAITFRGIAASTDVSGQVLIADIGGGSTELIAAKDGAVQSAHSIPLGSGRLTDRLVTSDPPSASEIEESVREATKTSAGVLDSLCWPDNQRARLIVVGGTGEFMARLVPDEREIDVAAVRAVLSRLRRMPAAELAQEIDIPEARARVLPAGVSIVAALAERLQPRRIEISHNGIRAGLLVQAFAETANETANDERTSTSEGGQRKRARAAAGHERTPAGMKGQPAGFREAMQALIAERWDDVWRTIPAAVEGKDIEGVHDVRVASRRLRAAMDIAAPLYSQRWYKTLHRAAKQITTNLGEVRDRDVLLEALRTDRAKAPLAEHPGIDRLIDRVERERLVARQEMENFLRGLLNGSLKDSTERRFGLPRAPEASPKEPQ